MTTTARALSVASVHLASINASRKKCGLALFTADELAQEFADVDRVPVRTKGVVPGTRSNQAATDSMWGGIVARLNATLPSRAPIAAGCTSSAPASNRTVDWGEISRGLNGQAGLASPARRAR